MLVILFVAACTVAPSPSASPGSPSSAPSVAPSAAASASSGPSPTVGSTGSTGPIPTATSSSSTLPTAGTSVPPTATPRPTPTAATTPTPSLAPTPSPTPAGFDPARVSVGYVAYATVPGRPLAIAHAGDGIGRLFVAEQDGRIYVVRNGDTDPDPFLDISGQVSGGGEQGLLGLAFHPDYPADPRVFVDYTDTSGDTVVSSFTVDPADPDRVDPGSEVVILAVDQPYSNHNGGAIAFGPDGYLHIALGDGGSGGDPLDSGQRLDTLLGKILRIDIDRSFGGRPYAIPSSNPFAGDAGRRGEIWLYGLRNPFRFSFDRRTGDLWIGDVGQGEWEEVDVARAGVGGLNFGWRTMEGSHCYAPASGCSTAGLTLPVVEYSHDAGCAVIGGGVYRGSAYPVLRGGYVFADTCTGITWAVRASASGPQALVEVDEGPTGIAGFGESETGELYAADLDGRIWRVTAATR